MKPFAPVPVAIVALLVVAGAALRAYHLNTALWFDEIVTLLVSVRPSLTDILSHFQGNNDHPLYSVLAHLSVSVLGEAPWTLRLPSVVFGVAAIPALYLVGTAVTSRFESLLAAAILTVSYHHIWFSQNARGYTLLLLCVLIATYALLRWLAHGGRANAAAYAIVAALGAYTHLTMVFVCVSHALVIGVEWLRRRRSPQSQLDVKQALLAFGGAGLLTVLLYAPKLAGVQTFFTADNISGTEVATPVWALVQAVQGLQLGFGTLWGIAIGGLMAGAGAWSYYTLNQAACWLFVLPVPVTLALGIAAGRPIFPRFVFFAMGFALLITIRGAAQIGSWIGGRLSGTMSAQRAGALVALLVAAGGVALSIRSLPYGYRFPKQDYDEAAVFVEQRKQPQDVVAVVGVTSAVPMQDYLGKAWTRVDSERELRALVAMGREVWVVFTFPAYITVNTPGLWSMLENDCVAAARFEGTVAGGAINVVRCAPSGI
jgi:hypothetical protein